MLENQIYKPHIMRNSTHINMIMSSPVRKKAISLVKENNTRSKQYNKFIKRNKMLEIILFIIFLILFILSSYDINNTNAEIEYRVQCNKEFNISETSNVEYYQSNSEVLRKVLFIYQKILTQNFNLMNHKYHLISPLRLTARYGKLHYAGINPYIVKSTSNKNKYFNSKYTINMFDKENLNLEYSTNDINDSRPSINFLYDDSKLISFMGNGGYYNYDDYGSILNFNKTDYNPMNLTIFKHENLDSLPSYYDYKENSNKFNNTKYTEIYDYLKEKEGELIIFLYQDSISSFTLDFSLYNMDTNDYVYLYFNFLWTNEGFIESRSNISIIFGKLFTSKAFLVFEILFIIIVAIYLVFIFYKTYNQSKLFISQEEENLTNELLNRNRKNIENRKKVTKDLKIKKAKETQSIYSGDTKRPLNENLEIKSKFGLMKTFINISNKNKLASMEDYKDEINQKLIESKKSILNEFMRLIYKDIFILLILLLSVVLVIYQIYTIIEYNNKIQPLNEKIDSLKYLFKYELEALKAFINENNLTYAEIGLDFIQLNSLYLNSHHRNNIKCLFGFIYLFVLLRITLFIKELIPYLSNFTKTIYNSLQELIAYIILLTTILLAFTFYFYMQNTKTNRHSIFGSPFANQLFLLFTFTFNSIKGDLYEEAYSKSPFLTCLFLILSFFILRLIIINFTLAIVMFNYNHVDSIYRSNLSESSISLEYKSYNMLIKSIERSKVRYLITKWKILMEYLFCLFFKIADCFSQSNDSVNLEDLIKFKEKQQQIALVAKGLSIERTLINSKKYYNTKGKLFELESKQYKPYYIKRLIIEKIALCEKEKAEDFDLKQLLKLKNTNLSNKSNKKIEMDNVIVNVTSGSKKVNNTEFLFHCEQNELLIKDENENYLDNKCTDEYLIHKEIDDSMKFPNRNSYFESQDDRNKYKFFYEGKYRSEFKRLISSLVFLILLLISYVLTYKPYLSKQIKDIFIKEYVSGVNYSRNQELIHFIFNVLPNNMMKYNLKYNKELINTQLLYDNLLITINKRSKFKEESLLSNNHYNKTSFVVTNYNNTNIIAKYNNGFSFNIGINSNPYNYEKNVTWVETTVEQPLSLYQQENARESIIDEYTDNILLEYFLLDSVFEVFIHIKITYEIKSTSMINQNFDIYTFKPLINFMLTDYIPLIFDLVLALMILYFLFFYVSSVKKEFLLTKYNEDTIRHQGNLTTIELRYIKDPYPFRIIEKLITFKNILELVIMCLSIIYIVSRIKMIIYSTMIDNELNSLTVYEMRDKLNLYNNSKQDHLLASELLLLAFSAKFFFIFELNKYFSLVVETALNSLQKNIPIIIILIIFQIGFVLYGYFSLGSSTVLFSSFLNSLISILLMLFGQIDFIELVYMNRFTGVFLIIVYLIVMNLLLLNLIIAVLNSVYTKVKTNYNHEEAYSYKRIFLFCCFKNKKEIDKQNNIITNLNRKSLSSTLTEGKLNLNTNKNKVDIKNYWDLEFIMLTLFNENIFKIDEINSNAEVAFKSHKDINSKYNLFNDNYFKSINFSQISVIRSYYFLFLNKNIKNLIYNIIELEELDFELDFKQKCSYLQSQALLIKELIDDHMIKVFEIEQSINNELNEFEKVQKLKARIDGFEQKIENDVELLRINNPENENESYYDDSSKYIDNNENVIEVSSANDVSNSIIKIVEVDDEANSFDNKNMNKNTSDLVNNYLNREKKRLSSRKLGNLVQSRQSSASLRNIINNKQSSPIKQINESITSGFNSDSIDSNKK